MNDDVVFCKIEGFTVRSLGDETLILDPNGTAIHVADEVGGFIYQQIDGIRPLSDILEAVLAEYDIDKNTARTDMLAFVGEMENQEILGRKA